MDTSGLEGMDSAEEGIGLDEAGIGLGYDA